MLHRRGTTQPTSAAAASSPILQFGNPGPVHDLLERKEYVLSYDRRNRVADWVGEHLTAESLVAGSGVDRDKSAFKEDQDVPAMFRALLSDYVSSGYDRGHQAPAADAEANQEMMDETFLLTNMCPQVGVGFNRQYWAYLESFVRDLTKTYADVYVFTGPLFLPHSLSDNGSYYIQTGEDNTGAASTNPGFAVTYNVIGKIPNVAVPTHFYKILLVTNGTDYTSAAFVLPNQAIDSSTDLKSFQVDIKVIERAAGLTFFSELDRSTFKDLCAEITCAV
ncbi:hypothetical protein BX666DRAFT_1853105 [Dichotomocladium elegans]|nr:hypothetical protein BX666DRAFT_1853105 [Dichotomocladium elegans]